MFAIIQNNTIVATGSIASLFPNTSFPPGGASLEFMREHNVHEIVDAPRMDERFYWVTQSGLEVIDGKPTRTYTSTPKLLEDRPEVNPDGTPLLNSDNVQIVTKGLKSQWISQIKRDCNTHLAATDWMVIRKAERGVEIPADVVEKRGAILAECDRLEAAITAARDMVEFIVAIRSKSF